MKKRLSFSQLTVLSISLLPAQQIITSQAPMNQHNESPAQLKSPTSKPASTQQGWFGALNPLGFLSASTQAAPATKQSSSESKKTFTAEEIAILNLAEKGKLYDEETETISSELSQKNLPTLSGIFTKLAEDKRNARTQTVNKMIEEVRARQAQFEKDFKNETEALEQLLSAMGATGFATPAVLRHCQDECKSHATLVNGLVIDFIKQGHERTKASKAERERMDFALQSAKGTATFKRSVSPEDQSAAHYAMRIVKSSSLNPKAAILNTTSNEKLELESVKLKNEKPS